MGMKKRGRGRLCAGKVENGEGYKCKAKGYWGAGVCEDHFSGGEVFL